MHDQLSQIVQKHQHPDASDGKNPDKRSPSRVTRKPGSSPPKPKKPTKAGQRFLLGPEFANAMDHGQADIPNSVHIVGGALPYKPSTHTLERLSDDARQTFCQDNANSMHARAVEIFADHFGRQQLEDYDDLTAETQREWGQACEMAQAEFWRSHSSARLLEDVLTQVGRKSIRITAVVAKQARNFVEALLEGESTEVRLSQEQYVQVFESEKASVKEKLLQGLQAGLSGAAINPELVKMIEKQAEDVAKGKADAQLSGPSRFRGVFTVPASAQSVDSLAMTPAKSTVATPEKAISSSATPTSKKKPRRKTIPLGQDTEHDDEMTAKVVSKAKHHSSSLGRDESTPKKLRTESPKSEASKPAATPRKATPSRGRSRKRSPSTKKSTSATSTSRNAAALLPPLSPITEQIPAAPYPFQDPFFVNQFSVDDFFGPPPSNFSFFGSDETGTLDQPFDLSDLDQYMHDDFLDQLDLFGPFDQPIRFSDQQLQGPFLGHIGAQFQHPGTPANSTAQPTPRAPAPSPTTPSPPATRKTPSPPSTGFASTVTIRKTPSPPAQATPSPSPRPVSSETLATPRQTPTAVMDSSPVNGGGGGGGGDAVLAAPPPTPANGGGGGGNGLDGSVEHDADADADADPFSDLPVWNPHGPGLADGRSYEQFVADQEAKQAGRS